MACRCAEEGLDLLLSTVFKSIRTIYSQPPELFNGDNEVAVRVGAQNL